MARRKPKADATRARHGDSPAEPIVGVRIIGGRLRGRRLDYSGDMRTRPMKDRLREAVFNLVGPTIEGKHAINLFAGTGALAFEALSRGASRATLIEQHRPTAELIRRNAALLGVEDRTIVVAANTFIWWHQQQLQMGTEAGISQRWQSTAQGIDLDLFSSPWAVFCSPPYDFYIDRSAEMLALVEGMLQAAPSESVMVVEADARMDFQQLPQPEAWDVRSYPPAVVGIYRKG